MPEIEPASDLPQIEQELAELRARSTLLESKMRELLQNIDGNSNYRNDIIWLAQEINQVQKQIKERESDDAGGRT